MTPKSRNTLTRLLASAALIGALGASGAVAALATTAAPLRTGDAFRLLAAEADGGQAGLLLLRASYDDDDHGHRHRHRHGDDCDDDHAYGDDDDDDCGGSRRGVAPAGPVAPPQNGLFESGAAPKAEVN